MSPRLGSVQGRDYRSFSRKGSILGLCVWMYILTPERNKTDLKLYMTALSIWINELVPRHVSSVVFSQKSPSIGYLDRAWNCPSLVSISHFRSLEFLFIRSLYTISTQAAHGKPQAKISKRSLKPGSSKRGNPDYIPRFRNPAESCVSRKSSLS